MGLQQKESKLNDMLFKQKKTCDETKTSATICIFNRERPVMKQKTNETVKCTRRWEKFLTSIE